MAIDHKLERWTYVTLKLTESEVSAKVAELKALGITESSRRPTRDGKVLISFAVPPTVGFGRAEAKQKRRKSNAA